MDHYKCFRCNLTNNNKTIFIKHLNRKFKCAPIIKDISTEDIYKYYFENDRKKGVAKSSQKCAKYSQNIAKNSQKVAKSSQYFRCRFCDREFKYKSSKYKHEKDRCKMNHELSELNDMKKLVKLLNEKLIKTENMYKKEIKNKDKQINELMKKVGINIGTQNIQNNIKILAYKDTDKSHLNDSDYISILNRCNFCVPHMIKKIHFDPSKPENHNIYISNIKNNYVMIYDGSKWNIKNRNEIINDMIEDKTNILEDKVEEWLDKGIMNNLALKIQ